MNSGPCPSRHALVAGVLVLGALAAGYALLISTAYRNAAIYQWDESRNVMNALMMAENGQWLVTYFHDHPDMWNTKPPLLIWLMVWCLKIFGYVDWAVRLPVGIAGGLTVLLIAGWSWRQSRSPIAGVASGVVLLSSYGFMGTHGASTADYDVPLTFLITGAAIAFHRWVDTGDRRMLPLTGLGFALAVLVKSVAGLMVLPGLALYALVRRRLPALLRERWTWLSLIGALAIIAAYYLAREQVNPGYLAAVVKNELTGRYLQVIENHDHGPAFYLTSLWGEPKELPDLWPGAGRYMPWMFVVPLLWALALASRTPSLRSLALFATCYTLPYLAVISYARTKLFWYDVPLYPFLAVLAGIGLREAMDRASAIVARLGGPRFVGSAVVLGIFVIVSGNALNTVYLRLRNSRSQNEAIRSYVQRLRTERPELHFTSFHWDGKAPYHFYVFAGSLEAQRRRGVQEPSLDAPAVVVCDPERLEKAQQENRTAILHGGEEGNPCVTLALLGSRGAQAGASN